MKFRKKPIVIEAEQFNPRAELVCDIDLPAGVRGTCYMEVSRLLGTSGCSNDGQAWNWPALGVVETIEGHHVACPGDWIVTGIRGERYPCKPDIFEATYEPVDLGNIPAGNATNGTSPREGGQTEEP